MSKAINKTLQLNNLVLVYKCDYNNVHDNENRLCISIVAMHTDDLEQCTLKDTNVKYGGCFNDEEFFVNCDSIVNVPCIIANILQELKNDDCLVCCDNITDTSILTAVTQALTTDINAWTSM